MEGSRAGLLSGEKIWIVGAGSGIGEACAMLFAMHGATLVLTGRRAEKLDQVAEAAKLTPERLLLAPGDMSKTRDAARVGEAIEARYGRLDSLVNCAGVNTISRDLGQLSSRSAAEVIDGNLKSAFLVTIASLPLMRTHGRGMIVHFASWAGRYYSAKSGAAYTAAKQGVIALSHSTNMEENCHGIRSTVICPGDINTAFLNFRPQQPDDEARREMLQPGDLADAAFFVLTRRSGVCVNELVVTPVKARMAEFPVP